jgi:hypothetical protein
MRPSRDWPSYREGLARGVAVMTGGHGAADSSQLQALLNRCEQLRAYARRRHELSDDPADLNLLDRQIEEWKHDSEIAPTLGNELDTPRL